MVKKILLRLAIVVVLVMCVRFFVQARYIPSSSMEPTLQIEDRVVFDVISHNYERGSIVAFYPPPIEMGGKDLSSAPWSILGRLTGLPFFPSDIVFVKRVIGAPGDVIKVVKGRGVFRNGELLDEPYVRELPNYDLVKESDIKGDSSVGTQIQPYPQSDKPITVPSGMVFVMGDNRNNTVDSHMWGYLSKDRIVGRALYIYSPISEWCNAPYWQRPIQPGEQAVEHPPQLPTE